MAQPGGVDVPSKKVELAATRREALSRKLQADIVEYQRFADHPTRSRAGLVLRLLFLQRLQAVVLFRAAQWIGRYPAVPVKWLNQLITGADVSSESEIGGGLQLFHPTGVVIGPRVRIGERCRIMQGVTVGHGFRGSPVLGDDVFIGAHAVIVGGIEIGDRASIGANCVVSFDVPSDAVVRSPKARVDRPAVPEPPR